MANASVLKLSAVRLCGMSTQQTVIHQARLRASTYCSWSFSLSQSPMSNAMTSACPALALIFVIFPLCAYSYTVRTKRARILSSGSGTRGWNCARPCSTKCFWSASCGDIIDSISSVSASILLKHEVANSWAWFLRVVFHSVLRDASPGESGIRARIAERARQIGE